MNQKRPVTRTGLFPTSSMSRRATWFEDARPFGQRRFRTGWFGFDASGTDLPYRDNQLASRRICAEKEIITGRDGSSLSCPYTGLICRPEYMSPPRWRRTFPGQPFLRPATDVIMDKIASAGAGGDVQNYLSCGFNIICRAQHSAHRRTSEGHFRLAASPAPQAQAGSPARQFSSKTLR